MPNRQHLNGCDYLMLGFDRELRKHGFAGNSCQIVLELGSSIPADAVKSRFAKLQQTYPILSARAAGIVRPRWQWRQPGAGAPRVRVHREEPGLCQKISNEPLAADRGELTRFDLIECAGGRMRLVFTWAHALMDATGAEHFLAMMGRDDLSWPESPVAQSPRARPNLATRGKIAWKYLHRLDQLCHAPPRSLGWRHREAQPRLHHRVETFSAAETELVRANSGRHSGALSAAQYHAAIAALELHQLHLRLASPSPSYVIPLPVGLRPKGTIEPLFSNQVAMLMLQFLPENLDSIASAVAAVKVQIADGMRAGLIESGRTLGELFRFLPLAPYMGIVKQGLRGEIGSLFYGDTAAVNPQLTSFLGASIEDFAHVAAITPSPGVGVIFYYFRGQLRMTVLYLLTVLSDAEAGEFAVKLRNRLLNP